MPKDLRLAHLAVNSFSGCSGGAVRPPLSGHDNLDLVHEGLYRLPSSPDPQVVFAGVTELLVPAVCDAASADIYLGDRLAQWQQRSPAGGGLEGGLDGTSATVYARSLPAESDGWTGDVDYLVALTCRWDDPRGISEPTIALIQIVARYATALVHLGQQAELIRAQEVRILHLERYR